MQITWWKGATASGSSGSPLIDMDTHKVVGVLTGGFASCETPKQPDYYGRLSAVSCLKGVAVSLLSSMRSGAVYLRRLMCLFHACQDILRQGIKRHAVYPDWRVTWGR